MVSELDQLSSHVLSRVMVSELDQLSSHVLSRVMVSELDQQSCNAVNFLLSCHNCLDRLYRLVMDVIA